MIESPSSDAGQGLAMLDAEMARQGADAAASISAAAPVAAEIAASLTRTRRLVLLGMGASHWVNRSAEILYRRAGLDVSTHLLSELLTSPLPAGRRTAIVTSQSGRSGEVLRLLEHGVEGEERFGLTLDARGDLARGLPSLVGVGGPERAFAATRSVTVSLALHQAVLAAFTGAQPLPPELSGLLSDPPMPDLAPALDHIGACGALIVSGRDELQGLADVGALGVMELGRFLALGLEGGALRHGPLEALGPDIGVVMLRHAGAAAALTPGLAAACAAAGAPVVVLDASSEAPCPGAVSLDLGRHAGMAALFAVAPSLQRLVVTLAARRVADVGRPLRSTKVTTEL